MSDAIAAAPVAAPVIENDVADVVFAPATIATATGLKSLDTVMREALLSRNLISAEDAAADEAREAAGLDHDEQATSKPDSLVDPEDEKFDQVVASAFDPPASPDGYRLDMVADYVPEAGSNFREVAHAAGLDQPMTKLLYDSHNRVAERGIPDAETLSREGREGEWTVRRMWGPSYDQNIEFARQEVQRVAKFEPGLVAYLESTGLGNDPKLVAAFASRGMARSGSKA